MQLSRWVPLVAAIALLGASLYAARGDSHASHRVGSPLEDPALIAIVNDYFDAYGEALVDCDSGRLWSRFSYLSTGMDLGRGINSERAHVQGICNALTAIHFDLEGYEPIRVIEHEAGYDVKIHGLERFDYRVGPDGGGEFLVTLSLQPIAGSLVLVRTDQVTLPEYHEGHR